jgi:hypothetical protein
LANSFNRISKSRNGTDRIPGQLKVKLTKKPQTAIIERLPLLTSLCNWPLRKIGLKAKGGVSGSSPGHRQDTWTVISSINAFLPEPFRRYATSRLPAKVPPGSVLLAATGITVAGAA